MKKFIAEYKYSILMVTLINFLLSPFWHTLPFISSSLITVINFSLVILASFNASEQKKLKVSILFFGLSDLILVWTEYGFEASISTYRMHFSLLLFSILFLAVIRGILSAKQYRLDVIVGAMCGFVLLGILGGVVFEMLEYHAPGSLQFKSEMNSYSFYYFSFINLTSVGFGDIIPGSSQAQAITILLGIIGQFYLAFGVAVLVGKFLNEE